MSRKAVFASDDILSHFHCKRNTSTATDVDMAVRDESEFLSLNGWTFRSFHGMMLDSKELCRIAAEISCTVGGTLSSEDHINVSDRILRLPSMIFGNDILSVEFNSDDVVAAIVTKGEGEVLIKGGETLIISIDAVDALSCWAAQHTLSSQSTAPLKILQVPCAKSWKESSMISPNDTERKLNTTIHDVEGSAPDKNRNIWDWTFTSDYCCTVANSGIRSSVEKGRAEASTTASVLNDISGSESKPLPKIISGRNLSGGLPYIVKRADLGLASSSVINGSDDATLGVRTWQRSSTSGIDYNLLRMQNIPILLFDEILLYQDDLEDCGDVIFDAKLRVMPICWFILSRFFVRVDDVIVRIRDTRLFHRFGDNSVHMEISWREADLSKNSCNSNPECSFSNAILTSPAACAERLPIVNDQEQVHRFYSLLLA